MKGILKLFLPLSLHDFLKNKFWIYSVRIIVQLQNFFVLHIDIINTYLKVKEHEKGSVW